jgi:hypothetical protein
MSKLANQLIINEDEDRANVAGSQAASAMMLRHFEYGTEKFLTWDGAVRRWEQDGGKFNVYEVFEDGSFDKIRSCKERTHK